MAPVRGTSFFGLNGCVPRAEQGMVLMVLSLRSLVKGSWQGEQFDYFASWTGVFELEVLKRMWRLVVSGLETSYKAEYVLYKFRSYLQLFQKLIYNS